MSSWSNALFALAFAPLVFAQDPLWTCDRATEPNAQDCIDLLNASGWQDNLIDYIRPLDSGACPALIGSEDQNCAVLVCFDTATFATQGEAWTNAQTVLQNCVQSLDAGGTYHDPDGYTVTLTNNEDYIPPSSARNSTATTESTSGPTPAQGVSVRAPRSNSMRTTKRQQPGDDHFVLLLTATQVEDPNSYRQIRGTWPSGSSFTIEESDSYEQGITSSVGGGFDFFEIFRADVQISYESSYTQSTSYGVEVVVDCPNEGLILAYPAFDLYSGYYTPSGTNVDWYIPLEGQTNYKVRCLG